MKKLINKSKKSVIDNPIDNSCDFIAIKNLKSFKNVHIGIDETGRGPVLGYMNYCLFFTDDKKNLEKMYLKDSKILSADNRKRIVENIDNNDNFGYMIYCMSPKTISKNMANKINLNKLAFFCIESIFKVFKKNDIKILSVISDTLGPEKTMKDKIIEMIGIKNVIVEKKADSNHKIVSAASIVAKVSRDMLLENFYSKKCKGNIKNFAIKDLNNINDIVDIHYDKNIVDERFKNDYSYNSGYPMDEFTVKWLKNNFSKTYGFPDIVRTSWETAKVYLKTDKKSLMANKIQKTNLVKTFKFFKKKKN